MTTQQAYQYVCNCHHSIGSAALALFSSFFMKTEVMKFIKQAQLMLNKNTFLYKKFDIKDSEKVFYFTFITSLLAEIPTTVPADSPFLSLSEGDPSTSLAKIGLLASQMPNGAWVEAKTSINLISIRQFDGVMTISAS